MLVRPFYLCVFSPTKWIAIVCERCCQCPVANLDSVKQFFTYKASCYSELLSALVSLDLKAFFKSRFVESVKCTAQIFTSSTRGQSETNSDMSVLCVFPTFCTVLKWFMQKITTIYYFMFCLTVLIRLENVCFTQLSCNCQLLAEKSPTN